MSHAGKIKEQARSYPRPGERMLAGLIAQRRLVPMPGAGTVAGRPGR